MSGVSRVSYFGSRLSGFLGQFGLGPNPRPYPLVELRGQLTRYLLKEACRLLSLQRIWVQGLGPVP